MEPVLAVLVRTDAFARVWAELAASAGARTREAASVSELAPLAEVCGIVVAVGGAEEGAADALEEVRAAGSAACVVAGAAADRRLATAVVRAGAADYFALPEDLELLRAWIAERAARSVAGERAAAFAAFEREQLDFSRMIGESQGLRAALDRAARVIPRAAATVLLTGETGTGKELLAQAIHYNGPRAAESLIEINCTALPATLLEAELFGYEKGAFTDARAAKPGLFEAAHRGTLFLDEIGDLSLELQAKLLKVLEQKRVRRLGSLREVDVDVRIIAATHVDLGAAVREGRFREDLYYRLHVVPIHLPPLREREGDIVLLARHFLTQLCAEYDAPAPVLTEPVRRALLDHSWPGNIRELRNAIERAMLLGDGALRPEDLFIQPATAARASSSTGPIPFPATMDKIERAAARAMLERHGNKSAAAEALGISRSRLYRLLGDAEPL